MRNNLLERLRIAAGQLDGIKWNPAKGHEGDLYAEAVKEIERLQVAIRHLYFNDGVCYGENCDECETVYDLVRDKAVRGE